MTDNATPKRRPNYSRPTKYPERLSAMVSTEQREAIDELVEADEEASLGDVVRLLLGEGLESIGYVKGKP